MTAIAAVVALPPGATLSTGSGGAAAAASASGGVFVQVSSLKAFSPASVATWMQKVCAGRDLVLQDIGGADGVLATAYLDAIAPFLPGGKRQCFRRAFVGTVDLPWSGSGSKYEQGIQDASFRQQNVSVSLTLAKAFVARYPKVVINWYLTYEANLNELFYPSVMQAYAALFRDEMPALAALRPHAVFAWSPAFWYPYSAYHTNVDGMTQLRSMLVQFFTGLPSGGIALLDLQDYVSGSSCQPVSNRMTPGDAADWTRFLIGLQAIPAVSINVEQYGLDCTSGGIVAGDAQEISAREAYYGGQNLVLGPAFEIRYWLPAHGYAL